MYKNDIASTPMCHGFRDRNRSYEGIEFVRQLQNIPNCGQPVQLNYIFFYVLREKFSFFVILSWTHLNETNLVFWLTSCMVSYWTDTTWLKKQKSIVYMWTF